MGGNDPDSVRIECQGCHFTAEVTASDDQSPDEVVLKHGRETGHKLSIKRNKH